MLKRVLAIMLSLLALVFCAGCSGRTQPLRICIDFDFINYGTNSVKRTVYDLENTMITTLGLTDYEIEYIPAVGAERSTALDRIRTEIMSGKGPDVFIVGCPGANSKSMPSESLFNMPEKSMELGLFLPLDEYIENAQYAEWDKFTKSVMDAGKNEEGQQLIPLTYTLPSALYRKSDFEYTPDYDMTWEEMLASEELYDAAVRLGDCFSNIDYVEAGYMTRIDNILGELADYEQEELAFTEETLLKHVSEMIELSHITVKENRDEREYRTESSLGIGFNVVYGSGVANYNSSSEQMKGLTYEDELTIVPLYSDKGGCTAIVKAFAAVNRNTKRAQDAFNVIDCLMMTNKQRYSELYSCFIYPSFLEGGLPMNEELMKLPVHQMSVTNMPDATYESLCEARNQINCVQFGSELNTILKDMMLDSFEAYLSGEDYSEIIHSSYTAMKQMLSE